MSDHRQEKSEEIIRELVSKFIRNESGLSSLITVTKVEADSELRTATIYVSVYPEDKEDAAIDFLKRKRTDCKHFIRENSKLFRIPFIDFTIDIGEKNRQKIDALNLK